MRVRTWLIIAAVVLVVLGGGGWLFYTQLGGRLPTALGPSCEVRTSAGTVLLEADQMANAATIAAVGLRRGVPDRGIAVALAASLQESKLQNLTRGDRDSVGLFQQRPSQGWGTEDQLRDPRFASSRFYSALLQIRDWEDMRITEAAQRVQRSAYPEAYEKWADEAGVLAEALAGRVTSAVACTQKGEPVRRGEAAAESLSAGLRLDWGHVTTFAATGAVGLVVAAVDVQSGWQFAHWIVAHSSDNGVERVRIGDQEWTADSGEWSSVDTPDTEMALGEAGARVLAQVYGG